MPSDPPENEPWSDEANIPSSHYLKLKARYKRLRRIFDGSYDPSIVVDLETNTIIECNAKAISIFDCRRGEDFAVITSRFVENAERPFSTFLDEVLLTGYGYTEDFPYSDDADCVSVALAASVLDIGKRRLLSFTVRDISERKRFESKIQHLAYHDALTNLPNRALLKDRIKNALARAKRSGETGALLFLDLDNFKRINDSLGHSIGDKLLQKLAVRLTGALRAEDTVARLGGDEFVVLVERLGRMPDELRERVAEIATKIRVSVSRPYRIEGHELLATASIGAVTYPADGDNVDLLLRHADMAMYHAKDAGRDATRSFAPAMDEVVGQRLRVENELRQALRGDRLFLHYQPVMTLRDNTMAGAEILLRWRRGDGELVTPSDFLPQIDDHNLIIKVADWVLVEVCRILAAWQDTPLLAYPGYLSVNLSHLQFQQNDFNDRVRQLLLETGADPKLLQFELTESAIDRDVHNVRQKMTQVRDLGIRFAIDDFGTGSSSLASLKELPLDTLKIDRSFVSHLTTDPNDEAIVEAVLSLARHFKQSVIAEGVENREQLTFLRDRGCEYYQGILARPPLAEHEFVEELVHYAALRDKR